MHRFKHRKTRKLRRRVRILGVRATTQVRNLVGGKEMEKLKNKRKNKQQLSFSLQETKET